jgi:hypothetical protein
MGHGRAVVPMLLLRITPYPVKRKRIFLPCALG